MRRGWKHFYEMLWINYDFRHTFIIVDVLIHLADDAPKSVEGDNPPPLLEEADSLRDSVKEVSNPTTEENILEVEIAPPPEAVAVAVAVGDIIAPIAPSQVALPTIPVPDTATPPPPLPLPTAARTSSASKKKGGSSKDTPSGTTGSRGRCVV